MKDLLIIPKRAERGAYIGGFGDVSGADESKTASL